MNKTTAEFQKLTARDFSPGPGSFSFVILGISLRNV